MSFDIPIVLSSKFRSSPSQSEKQNMLSPGTFRLNIAPTEIESGLRFQDAYLQRKQLSIGSGEIKSKEARLDRGVPRMMFAALVLVVVVLFILIFTIGYLSYRLSSSVDVLYYTAGPYLDEMAERVMSVARHADQSSLSLEHVMTGTEYMAATSIPKLMKTVNRTTSMIARLESVARNPVLKVSME